MSYTTSTSASFALTVGQSVAVRTQLNEGAKVRIQGVSADREYMVNDANSKTFGPFTEAKTVTVSALYGAVEYDYGTAPSLPAFVYSTPQTESPSGAALAIGYGADGTIPLPSRQALANSGVSLPNGAKNWKASNTVQIRASMAGAQGRDFRSRWIFIGDSSISGTQSARNNLVNARRKGWVSQLEDIGLANGYQVNENWWMGDSGNSTLATIATGDPRVAFGSTVSYTSTYAGPGRGVPLMATSASTGTITFTPRQTFDTVDCLPLTGNSGVGTFTVQNQSAQGSGSFNTQIGNGNAEYSSTVPAGSTSAVIATTGGNVYMNGFGTRDSTKPGIEIINIGISGIDLRFFNANPVVGNNWNGWRVAATRLMTSATKNVVVITGGANDLLIYGRDIETIKADMRVQIDALKALPVVPDIVFVSYANLASPNPVTFGALQQALIDLCINEYDLPVIDQRETMESGAVLQSLGMQAGDGLHNYASGQSITARNFWNACLASRSFVN